MAYYNGYQNYQPYMQNSGLIWVSGEAGAKAYLIAPNSTVALFDSENQVIYLKSADASGMPTIKTLDYTIREIPSQINEKGSKIDFATKDELMSIRDEISEIRKEIERYGKSVVQHDEQ